MKEETLIAILSDSFYNAMAHMDAAASGWEQVFNTINNAISALSEEAHVTQVVSEWDRLTRISLGMN